MNPIHKIILLIGLNVLSLACYGQANDSVFLYRRGSIYSLMISHRTKQFAQEIEQAFTNMPVPDRYYDHNVGKKVFYTSDKIKLKGLDKHQGFVVNNSADKGVMNDVDMLLFKQDVASRLVAKWFQRKRKAGVSNMELVQERGYQNALEVEKRLARLSVRKEDMLRDAGEELIGSTFVLVNDISYFNKGELTAAIGGAVSLAVQVYGVSQANNELANSNVGELIETYKGFNVKIKTYLYQLIWDEDIANYFYSQIYTEQPDEQKKSNFENNRGKFSLKFIGMQESSGSKTSFAGINEEEPVMMVRKACQRALDENVANLQKNFDCFKIKAPLFDVNPLKSEIGLKEGVTASNRFEVLEAVENEVGHVAYKRVGVIKPIENLIWDNRFMAKEEGAENAELGFTTFEKVSGSDFYPGMLIREIK